MIIESNASETSFTNAPKGRRYHRKNFLLRVAAMQREYMLHRNTGRSEMYVYRTWIYPKFWISRSTFYNWLAINPTRELEKLREEEPALFA